VSRDLSLEIKTLINVDIASELYERMTVLKQESPGTLERNGGLLAS
jgi:hypothetical protein